MKWARDPLLDSYNAETKVGTYHAVRTWYDVSILTLDSKELGRFPGSHIKSLELAEKDYKERIK